MTGHFLCDACGVTYTLECDSTVARVLPRHCPWCGQRQARPHRYSDPFSAAACFKHYPRPLLVAAFALWRQMPGRYPFFRDYIAALVRGEEEVPDDTVHSC